MDEMVTRDERRWILGYSILLAALTAAPYLLGFAAQGSAWRFSGFVFGVEDGNSYIAKMRLGAEGAWLFRSPYSAMSQRGVLAFLPYLLLGKLAGGEAMHEQLVALFHLARLAGIFLLVPATYAFAAWFLPGVGWRRFVTVLATAGGGLGWLAIVLGKSYWLGSLPLDVISPETFGFLAVYGLPHLVFARALLLIALFEYLRGRTGGIAQFAGAAALLLMGCMQPISLATAYAVLAMHVMLVWWTSRSTAAAAAWARRALVCASLSLPLFVYSLFAFRFDPFLVAWTTQNRILSPHPAHYLLAYGPMLILAGMGLVAVLREKAVERMLIAGWLILLPGLAYFPHNVQRRLPEGVWVALLTLAAIGLGRWVNAARLRRVIVIGLVAAGLGTSALIVLGGMQTAASPAPPAFVPAEKVRAFDWLARTTPAGSVVVSGYADGNALPAWAPVRVVIGHGPETVGLIQLRPQVEGFLAAPTSERLRALREEQGAEYVLVDQGDQGMASEGVWGALGLETVYDEGGVRIYDAGE